MSLAIGLALVAVAAIPIAVTAWLAALPSSAGVSVWNSSIVEGTELESYATLSEMVQSADAVVRGQVVSLVAGRVAGARGIDELHYAEATVKVSEVLAGAIPPGQDEILLEIPLFNGPEYLATMQAAVPWDESVYFLRNKGEAARRAGLSAEAQRAEAKYYRLVIMTAFIVSDRGRAAVAEDAHALEVLNGRSFANALSEVRASRDGP
ncbi:MAG TPA: hypothetical protein VHR55_08765 [Candidatus Limnocylindria bacterium]|nr:hypothetical protein [Candidatus Limnocylindria bacterium]